MTQQPARLCLFGHERHALIGSDCVWKSGTSSEFPRIAPCWQKLMLFLNCCSSQADSPIFRHRFIYVILMSSKFPAHAGKFGNRWLQTALTSLTLQTGQFLWGQTTQTKHSFHQCCKCGQFQQIPGTPGVKLILWLHFKALQNYRLPSLTIQFLHGWTEFWLLVWT